MIGNTRLAVNRNIKTLCWDAAVKRRTLAVGGDSSGSGREPGSSADLPGRRDSIARCGCQADHPENRQRRGSGQFHGSNSVLESPARRKEPRKGNVRSTSPRFNLGTRSSLGDASRRTARVFPLDRSSSSANPSSLKRTSAKARTGGNGAYPQQSPRSIRPSGKSLSKPSGWETAE